MKPNLAALKHTQLGAMDDLCNIVHRYHASGTVTTSTDSNVACGIEFVNGQQVAGLQGVLTGYNLVLRLPLTQAFGITDTVELVRKGDMLVSGTYQVAAYPEINSSVQKVKLLRVRS